MTDFGPIEVRDVCSADLPDVIQAHQSAFPGFLMTMLGPRFLRTYYQTVLDYPDRIFLAILSPDNRLCGFVAGFAQPRNFYRLFDSRRRQAMISAFLYVAIRPAIWKRVLENIQQVRARSADAQLDDEIAELASICVDPDSAGYGFGKQLVVEFLNRAKDLAMESVILTTYALNNDRINSFYEDLGFKLSGTTNRVGGRVMNKYRYEIRTNLQPLILEDE